jgi:hypothetical protein
MALRRSPGSTTLSSTCRAIVSWDSSDASGSSASFAASARRSGIQRPTFGSGWMSFPPKLSYATM